MKNNMLFTVTDISLINDLKGLGISKFVYPLSFFCVGIPKTFELDEIKEENAYLYVNRIMDTKTISDLEKIIEHLPENIRGIIFDDIGVIELVKDLDIEKILYNSHFCTNYESINHYFEYVDEVIVSTDITEEEIDEIISKTNKKVSLLAFGLVPSMYSRRTLLKNHSKQFNLQHFPQKDLNINDKKFIAVENEYGTVIYHYPYFNGSRLLNKDVKYLFYFPMLLDKEKVLQVAKNNFSIVDTDEGFLDTKTIYKVKNND